MSAAHLIPWAKGQSGNPGGRPKGFAHRIQKTCGKDGRKLVKGWTAIAFGTDDDVKAVFGEVLKRTVEDRHKAMIELANRGFGRPMTLEPEDAGVTARPVIINLPMPPKALEGRQVVTGLFQPAAEPGA
jgi:hypothetical protein